MKTLRVHNGTYSCPECCIEYDLEDESDLCCDNCEGVLYAGSLKSLQEEDEDNNDDEGE